MRNDATSKNLTRRQLRAVELLGEGAKVSDVAEALSVHRSTIFRWHQNDNFLMALKRRRDEVWGDLLSRARALVPAALSAAEAALAQSDNLRLKLRAAELILKNVGLSSPQMVKDAKSWREFCSALTPSDD